jgi:hypothetical protein
MSAEADTLASLETIKSITELNYACTQDLCTKIVALEQDINTLKLRQARIEGAMNTLRAFSLAKLLIAVAAVLIAIRR